MRYRPKTPAEKNRAIDEAVEYMNKVQWAGSGNYTANDDTHPTKVTFANGRTVEIVDGHLVVGWVRNLPEPPPKWAEGYHPPTVEE